MALYNSIEAIASRVQLEVTNGVVTDDEASGGPSLEYIKDLIHVERDFLIGQVKRNAFIQPDFYQRLCCLKIQCTDVSCDPSRATGIQKVYVDAAPIAQSLGLKAIKEVSVGETTYFPGAIYKKGDYTYLIEGSRVYLSKVNAGAIYACVNAVFYDPSAAFRLCEDITEKAYSLPSEYLTHVEQRVVARLMNQKRVPKDIANDSR